MKSTDPIVTFRSAYQLLEYLARTDEPYLFVKLKRLYLPNLALFHVSKLGVADANITFAPAKDALSTAISRA